MRNDPGHLSLSAPKWETQCIVSLSSEPEHIDENLPLKHFVPSFSSSARHFQRRRFKAVTLRLLKKAEF